MEPALICAVGVWTRARDHRLPLSVFYRTRWLLSRSGEMKTNLTSPLCYPVDSLVSTPFTALQVPRGYVLEIRAHAMRAMGSRACRRWPLLLLLCRIAPVPAALLGRAPIRISLASPPRCRRTIPACAADKQQLLLPRLGPVCEAVWTRTWDVRKGSPKGTKGIL